MSRPVVTVKINLDITKSNLSVQVINDPSTAKKVGNKVVLLMKQLIAKGISPVRGVGKFLGYATQRLNDKTKYPRDSKTRKEFPDKKVRPVNLFLSGEMLSELDHTRLKNGVQIGFHRASKRSKDKAETHNYGTGSVPKRKFLPVDSKDELNVSIMREIKSIYINRIKSIIKGLNK